MSNSTCLQDGLPARPRVAAVALAAGRSRRMGSRNKLLIEIAGQSIIAHTVNALTGSRATQVLVVTGHQRSAVARALRGKQVHLVHNADYRCGLSSSLRCGITAVSGRCDAVLIALGDMPLVTSAEIDHLITAFQGLPHPAICIPTFRATRGNPVIFPRALFPEPARLRGDTGAQRWIANSGAPICAVEMKTDAVLRDIDSPSSLYRLRYRLPSLGIQDRPTPWPARVTSARALPQPLPQPLVDIVGTKTNPWPR